MTISGQEYERVNVQEWRAPKGTLHSLSIFIEERKLPSR